MIFVNYGAVSLVTLTVEQAVCSGQCHSMPHAWTVLAPSSCDGSLTGPCTAKIKNKRDLPFLCVQLHLNMSKQEHFES